jgi:hypothetical protein
MISDIFERFRRGPENVPRKIAEGHAPIAFAALWRELARLITLFDEHSPSIFSEREIGEFFRNWRARQGSNLRPSA